MIYLHELIPHPNCILQCAAFSQLCLKTYPFLGDTPVLDTNKMKWADFKIYLQSKICEPYNLIEPKIHVSHFITFPQLLEDPSFEEVYNLLGINSYYKVFLECNLYIKWGESLIVLTDINKPNLRPTTRYKETNEKWQNAGFNESEDLKIHRMYYRSNFKKRSALLFSKKPIDQLYVNILKTNVGQSISHTYGPMDKKLTQILGQLLARIPSIDECEQIFNSMFTKKVGQ